MVLAAVVVVVLGAGVAAVATGAPGRSKPSTASTANTAKNTAAAGCTGEDGRVRVAVDPSAVDWLRDLAQQYNAARRQVDGRCAHVEITVMTAEQATSTLRDGATEGPDAWIPESSGELDLLRSQPDNAAVLPERTNSLASSPLVLAAPTEAVRALESKNGDKPPALADLLALAQNPAGWAAAGHPDWGRVRFSVADPTRNATGTSLVVAAAGALAEVPATEVTAKTFTDLRAKAGLRAMVHATAVRAESRADLLDQVRRSTDAAAVMKSMGLVALTEQDVWRHNGGRDGAAPAVPLQAVYPLGGSLAADFPYVVPTAGWVSNFGRNGAGDFSDWLRRSQVQDQLADFGLRPADGAALRAAFDRGVAEDALEPVAARDSAAAPAALAAWRVVTRPVSTLAVIDVSGSMGAAVEGTNSTRLGLTVQAALTALPYYADNDHTGMWEFSTNLQDGKDYRELVPTGPAGSPFGEFETRRAALEQAYRSLIPHTSTGLYDTVLAAYDSALKSYQPGYVNTVVVLTDGANEDSNSISLETLLAELTARQDKSKPVHIVTVGYGGEASVDVLKQIAETTGGLSFSAPDPRNIGEVFLTALSSLGE